jgi:dTDP-4-amino-4,6-dideoxygalactose transaminase
VKAVIPVSLMGYPAEMPAIMKMAYEDQIFVIEDAAQALGAEYQGRKIGTFGNAGSFSFQESKTITTLGEGGMIVTDDDALANKLFHLRNQGNVYGDLTEEFVCTNARLTEAQAAFGRIQLSKILELNRTQKENAEYFLTHLPGELKPVYQTPLPQGVSPSYLLIPVYAPDMETRDRLISGLVKAGVSKNIAGQNVGWYRQLISEAKVMKLNRDSFISGQNCKNAVYAKNHILLFDVHRFNHSIDDIKNYLEIMNAQL